MPDLPFDPADPRSLARALANELTDAESATLRRWLAEDPRRHWEFEQLRRAWSDAGRMHHRWDAESALTAIKRRARAEASPPIQLHARPRLLVAPPSIGRRAMWAAAACIAALAIGTVAIRHLGEAPTAPAVAVRRDVHTDVGETAELRFPDGTEIRLGPKSRLAYPADMLGPSRDLDLEGEAYVVAGRGGHAPLVVHTALGTTRDVGTRFVVQARSGEPLDVVVVDGLVVLHARPRADGNLAARADSAVVRPGMLARIDAAGRVAMPRHVRVDAYLAWLDGRLAFTDAPLADVFATLARWRSVRYRIEDSTVARRRFTGTFDYRDGLADVADLIALSTNVRIERRGDSLLVRDDPTRRAASGASR